MMKRLILLFLSLPLLAFSAEPSATAKREIAHLVGYLKGSGCQFNRNGTWYGPAEAADHLDQKYQYLIRKGLVATADEFIARAASDSSMSGRPYQVRCGSSAAVPSAPWLRAELVKWRTRSQGG